MRECNIPDNSRQGQTEHAGDDAAGGPSRQKRCLRQKRGRDALVVQDALLANQSCDRERSEGRQGDFMETWGIFLCRPLVTSETITMRDRQYSAKSVDI